MADGSERAPLLAPRLATALARVPVAVVVAAVVGFGSATLLADWRTDRLGETDAGTLSLEIAHLEEWGDGRLGRSRDGRPVRTLPVEIRNTGPREVALDRVWLAGTDWTSEDAPGRRVAPRRSARIVLLKPVDCDRLPEPGRSGPEPVPSVVVRAVTDAGMREQRVPGAVDGWVVSGEPDRQACGAVPADEAVQAVAYDQRFFHAGTELRAQLVNRSRYEVEVTAVRVPPGLRVQVLDESAQTLLPMPLRLPAADFRVPREVLDEGLPSLPVTLRVTVADCALLAPTRSPLEMGRALLELDVESELGNGVTHLPDDNGVLYRLHAEGC